MAALVEFHDAANLPRVLASGADLIGINNRDLRHFVTDIEHTLRLRDQIPPEVVLVSESGIRTRRDVERLEAAGVSAILVGESLMRATRYRSGRRPAVGPGILADDCREQRCRISSSQSIVRRLVPAAWPCPPASGSAYKRTAPSLGRR